MNLRVYAVMNMFEKWCKERALKADEWSLVHFLVDMEWLNVEKVRKDISDAEENYMDTVKAD